MLDRCGLISRAQQTSSPRTFVLTDVDWSALIDHAIVGEDGIRFIFRTGKEITVKL
ncbi:MAG: hypothetical protein E6700_00260 [Winkia neuii]|uniref:hypothetical protein n=1 Tax=Winkia neuii TaxID=33007 RepID=UPI000B11C987|nr:hypothetical protein [Winkia neuii]MDK8098878.1 hypothetical protein [Winkia neuii]MDU3133988.1 hypothetical protein [Winkia neuii]